MDTTTLENWLWEAVCSIRGPLDAPKFKDYILSLLFYKRLSDVYEDEMDRLAKEFGGKAKAQKLARADRGLIRFYIPEGHLWAEVRANSNKLGERLTDTMKAIGRENPKPSGVIDRRGEGQDLGNLGNAYLQLGDTRRAIGYYELALAIRREIGDAMGVAADSFNMARLYAQQGQAARALPLAQQAAQFYAQLGHPEMTRRAQELAARLQGK